MASASVRHENDLVSPKPISRSAIALTNQSCRSAVANAIVGSRSLANHERCSAKDFEWSREQVSMIRIGSPRSMKIVRSSGSLPVAFVSSAFAGRAAVRFGMALFPVPAHRTGQAHLAHPALGERFTVSPTESCLAE